MKYFNLKRSIWGMGVFLMVTGCATTPKTASRAAPVVQDHFAEIERPSVPLVMNNRVQDWMDYFQGRGHERFERYLSRSGRYIPMMRKILRENGLPENLVYLSMIESGFNPHAYSRARATGAWQFIYQTGVRYGLRADSWVDQRRDPEKSTVAAAKYLKELYDRFQDWYLAAASYNAGEGKINRAIKKYATEDFWELSQRRYLKAETKNYVPKLIAAALISMNPEKYGFEHVVYEEPVSYEEVSLTSPIDLRVAARCAGTTYEELKALNPELLRWITPPEEYSLRIPQKTSQKFEEAYANLQPGETLGDQHVSVKSKTTLAALARQKRIPVGLLVAANGLSMNEVIRPGDTIVLPYAPPEGESYKEKVYDRLRGRKHRGGGAVVVYVVRNGDHIARVSQRTGISVAALKKYNAHIDWDSLKSGQRIKLYAAASRSEGVRKRKHRRVRTAVPRSALLTP